MDCICRYCKKRKVGCKKECLEYTVENILMQPEREQQRKKREFEAIFYESHQNLVVYTKKSETPKHSPIKRRIR